MKSRYEIATGSKALVAFGRAYSDPTRYHIAWYSLDCSKRDLAALIAMVLEDADKEGLAVRIDCYPPRDAEPHSREFFASLGFASYQDSGPFRLERSRAQRPPSSIAHAA